MLNSEKWYMYEDESFIMTEMVSKGKFNKLANFKSCDKYQRLYLKNISNVQINESNGGTGDNESPSILITFNVSFLMCLCKLVSTPEMQVDESFNNLGSDSSDQETDFYELIEDAKVINLPTESVMKSRLNFSLFQNEFKRLFKGIEVNMVSQKSAISDILMKTLEVQSQSKVKQNLETKDATNNKENKSRNSTKSNNKKLKKQIEEKLEVTPMQEDNSEINNRKCFR